ncbi:hypothetical protein CROQUDRAFT_36269 [Cronartium quercuum f. sp. fusiforme G11]|uniref:Fungal lipase-type domain-containing protein n=1 Tax=Cronartium quercuum f. sp. fusiforme G11 TaxID=708437 RepID=A0A9P6NWR6_9BASI|nr:hypothetical protein CROQUDRAFT_36269 [Cronartium quercuum f. sp. fusiforme G11]
MDYRPIKQLLMPCQAFLSIILLLSNFGLTQAQVTDGASTPNVDANITDPVAIQASITPWYILDPFQQDHIRFHCYLSMAAYGDYASSCPSTFAVQGNDFEILETFSTDAGQAGFTARVPLMDKIVITFRGYQSTKALSWDTVPIDFGHLTPDCNETCTTGKGILDLYNSARIATNDWAIAKAAVNRTGHKFSVTGHAIGGAVAQLAALDLGAQGLVHYAHSQAAPRCMSDTASSILARIFQGESSQHVVANNDFFPHVFPPSPAFTRPSTSVWIFGNRTQYLQSCPYYSENSACLGNGTSFQDHLCVSFFSFFFLAHY